MLTIKINQKTECFGVSQTSASIEAAWVLRELAEILEGGIDEKRIPLHDQDGNCCGLAIYEE